MPAGISNPVTGYIGFAAVKLVGYSIAAKYISRAYAAKNRNAFVVGAARMAIGIAVGAAYYLLLDAWSPSNYLPYLCGLLPIRIGEWWLLVWLFYDRHFRQPSLGWKVSFAGTAWSYVCDIPAIAGFIYAGGVWIC